jgi:hypothetical protein
MKAFRWLSLILLLLGVQAAMTGAQSPALIVDASDIRGPISPWVFGANYGLLNSIPFDLTDEAADLGIMLWRFPGGRVGDTGDLQSFQINMFMQQARQFGITPMIHARLENGTPEKAAALVRYVNVENDYDVRFWSIGNEPDLWDDYTTGQYTSEWRAVAEAMRAVDPEILLIGPDVSQFTGDGQNARAEEFLRAFLRENGDLVDFVAVHRYPFPRGSASTTIDDLRADAPAWDGLIANLRALIFEETGRELPIAVNEVSSHWSSQIGGAATPDSHYNAIWWADVFGRLIRNQVEIVSYFNMQTSDRLGGHGLLAQYEVRPTYYTYILYKQFGDTLVHAGSPDNDVTIYAALNADGALTLIIVNLTDTEQTRVLELRGATPAGDAAVTLFDAVHAAEAQPALAVANGTTLTLPPQSITLLTIPLAG